MTRTKKIQRTKPLFHTLAPPGRDQNGEKLAPVADPIDIELDQEERRLRELVELPHLYGWKWYSWAAKFRDSTNQINLLCAANQISKSSTQIRKCILWATDQTLWPNLWAQKPVQFWYLYPTQKQVNAEFETKWKQFLPRGEMQADPYYGWSLEKSNNNIIAIHFHSGVHLYFKTYAQKGTALQTGTVDALFADEELPVETFDELMLRISAANGYFHMVFTATLGQDFWRRAMEPEEGEKEELPQAFKQTVSLYDAMVYEDGTPSHWTLAKIKQVEARCSTQNEVLKRVFGKFISVGGRKYESFDIKRHIKPYHPIPKGWLIYTGADIGGGGKTRGKGDHQPHKSALVYVAVKPDFRQARVFLGWQGEDGMVYTAGDVVQKHLDLVRRNKLQITGQYYDWHALDFGEIATRMGTPFEMAEKSHEIGEDIINTLFKNDMMYIYDDPELMKLASQLASIKSATMKKNAVDDMADAFRYAITKIPWDWSALTGARADDDPEPLPKLSPVEKEIDERRQRFEQDQAEEHQSIEDEFNEWNEAYGN